MKLNEKFSKSCKKMKKNSINFRISNQYQIAFTCRLIQNSLKNFQFIKRKKKNFCNKYNLYDAISMKLRDDVYFDCDFKLLKNYEKFNIKIITRVTR